MRNCSVNSKYFTYVSHCVVMWVLINLVIILLKTTLFCSFLPTKMSTWIDKVTVKNMLLALGHLIRSALEHFWRWWLHWLPGQLISTPDHSATDNFFLLSSLNFPMHNSRPFPPVLSSKKISCCVCTAEDRWVWLTVRHLHQWLVNY